jgi:hypothetical protein
MSKGLKKWAEKPSPLNNESLSSWMIRTALANLNSLSSLLDYIQDYYLDYKIYTINKDYDLEWFPDLMELFSDKTETPINSLKSMSLSHLNFKVDEITKVKDDSTWRNNIYQELWLTKWKSRYGTGLRFCPLCFKEDKTPFFKNRWRLRYITFCPDHKCLLENTCPNCNRYIAPSRLKWDYSINQCYNCGFDLSLANPILFDKNDKILKISTEYLTSPKLTLNEIYRVLSESWAIKSNDLDNKVFQNHPFTKDDELIDIWKGISDKYNRDNRRHLFSNLKASFLLIGAAIKTIIKQESKNSLDKLKPLKFNFKSIKSNRNEFPIWAELIEGESLSSWLVRTALQNSMDYFSLISLFLKDFDSSHLYDIKNVDFLNYASLFKYLSKVSNNSLQNIKKMSLSSFGKWIDVVIKERYDYGDSDEFKLLWKTEGIYNYEMGLRYCPLCLRQDSQPHFRKKWRLRFIPICLEHNCYLTERCPKCNGLIKSYTLRWGAFNLRNCNKCNADLSQAEPEFIDLNGPLLIITKDYFSKTKNPEEIFNLLYKAWNEILYYNITDEIYNNHPLSLEKELIDLWNNRIPPHNLPNRNLIFTNIKAVYLLIGTAIKNILDISKKYTREDPSP